MSTRAVTRPDDNDTRAKTGTDGLARPTFARLLRDWRKARGASQLDLATSCGISQRHLSFLESGRARPSRGMVLHLADALAVPLRDQNGLLVAAGFAPAFGPRPKGAPDLVPIEGALDQIMARHDPFPALMMTRLYELRGANRGAQILMERIGLRIEPDLPAPNIAELTLDPNGLRGVLENWEEVARWLLRRLRAEAALDAGRRGEATVLLEKLTRMAGAIGREDDPGLPDAPVLTTRFRFGETRLALFSMIVSLGTPLDAGLADLHVELTYPVDPATDAWFRRAAEKDV